MLQYIFECFPLFSIVFVLIDSILLLLLFLDKARHISHSFNITNKVIKANLNLSIVYPVPRCVLFLKVYDIFIFTNLTTEHKNVMENNYFTYWTVLCFSFLSHSIVRCDIYHRACRQRQSLLHIKHLLIKTCNNT